MIPELLIDVGLPAIPDDLPKRRGMFVAPGSVRVTDFQTTMVIMGQCVVLRAEYFAVNDTVLYHALSPHFLPIDLGTVIPTYNWHLQIIQVDHSPVLTKIWAHQVEDFQMVMGLVDWMTIHD